MNHPIQEIFMKQHMTTLTEADTYRAKERERGSASERGRASERGSERARKRARHKPPFYCS